MLAFLLTLAGFALVESFNVLNLGATSAIAYDSRLHRRSPLPGGLGLLAGLFTATAAVGITVVLGVTTIADRATLDLQPQTRYRGELVIGVVLIGLSCYRYRGSRVQRRTPASAVRRSPCLLYCAGIALGFGQAVTDVMYLAALAMLSTHVPRPTFWPAVVLGYCAIELWPPLLVLALAARRTVRAPRIQRSVVRAITRWAPLVMRALSAVAGLFLITDAAVHRHHLW